jgi:hypothetical protein
MAGYYDHDSTFEDRLGKCYEVAARWVLDSNSSQTFLIHGTIQGEGHPRLDHAWCESAGQVFEAVEGKWYDKYVHEQLFNAEETLRYTKEEVLVNILKEEHWGPWDMRILVG